MIGAELLQHAEILQRLGGGQCLINVVDFLLCGKRFMAGPHSIVPAPAIVVGADMTDLAPGLRKGTAFYGFRILKHLGERTLYQKSR